ncbi:LysE family transporter [Cytophagales bacterium LB-30]|uniref:LysE family transporter n=1 Tax=Shiella aurantiaca TaxID=3058365 RepID=A0ABT8F129_9BACT|nr:LysE family transporter [Shiella aurantiaca]MDN4164161.1 LysE family transporter [Shiella aurantiaca]
MALVLFFLATAMSFLGSLQPGPINMLVIQTAFHKKFKGAYLIGLGGCMAELIYSSLAFATSDLLIERPAIKTYSGYALIIIFLYLAFNSFQMARHPKAPKTIEDKKGVHFMKGWLIGMLNPQLLTYWLLIIIYFNNVGWMVNPSLLGKACFVLGTAAGAMLLHVLTISLVKRYNTLPVEKTTPVINYGMVVIFLGLALHQAYQLFA